MTGLGEVRLLVPLADGLRKLAKLVTWKTDASIYVIPYSSGRRYHIGQWRLEAHREEQWIPFGDFPVYEGAEPKLSLHENGQAHVTFRGRKVAGPVQIPPLAELRGEHIATVWPDDFSVLPIHDRPPKLEGRERDLVVEVDEGVTSRRIVLYANAVEPRFAGPAGLTFEIERPSIGTLHVGVLPCAQPPLGSLGITMLGGHDPFAAKAGEEIDVLVVRGVVPSS